MINFNFNSEPNCHITPENIETTVFNFNRNNSQMKALTGSMTAEGVLERSNQQSDNHKYLDHFSVNN